MSFYKTIVCTAGNCCDMATTDAFDHSLRACNTMADSPRIRKCQLSQTGATAHWSRSTTGGAGWSTVNYCSSKCQPFAWRETPLEDYSLWISTRSPQHYADWHLALRYAWSLLSNCECCTNKAAFKLACVPVSLSLISVLLETAWRACKWLITAYLYKKMRSAFSLKTCYRLTKSFLY